MTRRRIDACTPTVRLLIGLFAGLILGNIVSVSNVPALRAIPNYVEPIGRLWAKAIRMTVIPLIVSLLVTSIAADRVGSSVYTIGGRLTALMIALIRDYGNLRRHRRAAAALGPANRSGCHGASARRRSHLVRRPAVVSRLADRPRASQPDQGRR
jgi:hypothetical protein